MKFRFCPGYLPQHCTFECDKCEHVRIVETDAPGLVAQYSGTCVEVPDAGPPQPVPPGTRLPVWGHRTCDSVEVITVDE